MGQALVYVDRSHIRPGKREELRDAMRQLARFVEENEPRLLAFHMFFDDEGRKMTVMHVHDGADSLDEHFRVAGPKFGRFADLIDLERIEVYGTPSASALEEMERKADALGAGTVEVHRYQAGFMRTGGAEVPD